MKTLVLANQKGGVGKSAVATLLANYLFRQGKRVLALDFVNEADTPVLHERLGVRASDVFLVQL